MSFKIIDTLMENKKMTHNNLYDLEIQKHKLLIEELIQESNSLKKAIWDLLNYSNVFLLLLDSKMTVKLSNWSLAKTLGFDKEKDLIGKCWLEFIPEHIDERIKMIYHSISFDPPSEDHKYREMTHDVKTLNNKTITIKWFNTQVNHESHMTMSMGLKLTDNLNMFESEDSIRAYYHDIIKKDRTMITSLKDVVLKRVDNLNVCEV